MRQRSMLGNNTMPGKRNMADVIRRAVKRSGVSRRELCRIAGVDCGNVSRFMAGKHGLTLDSVEKLAGPLGLKLVQDEPRG